MERKPIEVVVQESGRLDRFLAEQFPGPSRSRWAEWIQGGHVWVDGVERKSSFQLRPGMVVRLDPLEERPVHDMAPSQAVLDVRYEDDELMIVNKPRGMATHPAPGTKAETLVNALLGRQGALSTGVAAWRPGIVHRLDKDTSGLLVIAKTDACHAFLARQIANRTAGRKYIAWVLGHLGRDRVRIDGPIGRDPSNRIRMAVVQDGKPAVTHVATILEEDRRSLVKVSLETGRTHQIRVHLAAIGHAVLGDTVYGNAKSSEPMQLHAACLALVHPSGKEMVWTAEPPADFHRFSEFEPGWVL